MQPTCEELSVTVESQQKEIEGLKKEVEKLQKTVVDITGSVKQLRVENKKLSDVLRKYHNENTPSGSSPHIS